MPSYSGSGCANYQAYADLWLTKLKDAFIDANSAWSLETAIETIGSYSGDSYGLRTLQLKSSASGQYLRIWAFAGSVYAYFQTSTGTNTSESLSIYTGNLMRFNYESNANRYNLSQYCEVYFGVSSSSIDPDFAKDLNLDIPIFGVNNWQRNEYSEMSGGYYGANQYGAIVSVITDGSMFGIIKYCDNKNHEVFYAPDMFICANGGDAETAGVISTMTYDSNFYLGQDNNSSYYSVFAVFNAADGTHDFNGMVQGFNNNRGNKVYLGAENSTKMICVPVCFGMSPYQYSGSTMTGVIDGIGFKGWINTDYIRSVDSTVLPSANKGLKYANGRWLCVDAGTLICWDDSNSSPFEAAT
jgi:hypothetical protein